MKVLEKGFIRRGEDAKDGRRVCAFMTMTPRIGGKIYACFRQGKAKHGIDGNSVVASSSDEGRTWEIVSEGFQKVYDGHEGDISMAALTEPEPGRLTAWLTWFDWSGRAKALYSGSDDSILPSRMILADSRDGGRTWKDYRTVDTSPYGGCAGTGPAVRLKDGSWMVSFERYERDPKSGVAMASAHCLTTRDGRNFSPITTVARHPEFAIYYWDQRHSVSPVTGRPVAMFWTYDRKAQKDLPIHIAWANPTGKTWETPRSTGIRGQLAAPLPLPDGRLLAFYVHRHPPGSMSLIMSPDGGKTWDEKSEISVYDHSGDRQRGMAGESDYAKYWEDMGTWTFGHPTGTVLDDKTVLLAYYAGVTKECMSACWARVEV